MKVSITYVVEKTETFDVPKEWEFYFKKDEDDYTDEEWDRLQDEPFLNRFPNWDDFEIEGYRCTEE